MTQLGSYNFTLWFERCRGGNVWGLKGFTVGQVRNCHQRWHPVAAPEIFLWGGIEGAKCDSEGAKIQKFAENGWFWPFFPSDWGGKWGGRVSDWGAFAPQCPSLMPPLVAPKIYIYFCVMRSQWRTKGKCLFCFVFQITTQKRPYFLEMVNVLLFSWEGRSRRAEAFGWGH